MPRFIVNTVLSFGMHDSTSGYIETVAHSLNNFDLQND